jgi:hypothetical protein
VNRGGEPAKIALGLLKLTVPLEVLARHAELRDAAAPGSRVLALAASLPIGRLPDWAAVVRARPVSVSVDPRTVEAWAPPPGGRVASLCRGSGAKPTLSPKRSGCGWRRDTC